MPLKDHETNKWQQKHIEVATNTSISDINLHL